MLAFAALTAGTVVAADWPQFMGPTADGIAPDTEKTMQAFPAGGPKVLWSVPAGDGFSSPAIVGGKVYFLDRPSQGATEKFSCIDLESGKTDWSIDNESGKYNPNYGVTRGTPAIDGDMAYTMGVTGDVLAIDLKGKKILWKKNIVKDWGASAGGWGFAMSPVVLRDLLLVDTPGSKTTGLVALDKKTGEQKWASSAFGAGDTYTTPLIVTIDGVEQAVCWHKNSVGSVSTADGKVLWKYDWTLRSGRPIPNPVYMGEGKFFLTTGYGQGCAMLKVAKKGDGFAVEEVFQDSRTASKVSNAIFYKGYIYTNASDANRGLQCIDPEGNIKWTGKTKFGLGSMIIADGNIWMLSGDNGSLYMIKASPDSYQELGSAVVVKKGNTWSPLALSNGKLIVRDQESMKCLEIGK
jgi:hypothetical protein